MLASPVDAALPVDDPRQDLGAAEVDADDAFPVQTARLPYWLDGDGRKALPRLPGRAREGQGAARAAPRAAAPGPQRTRAPQAEDPQAPPAVELEAANRDRRPRHPPLHHRLVDRRLPLVPQRRAEGERSARPGGARGARETDRPGARN